MTFGAAIDVKLTGEKNLTNKLLHLISAETSIHAGRDLMGTGLVLMGGHATTLVGRQQVFMSIPDTSSSWEKRYMVQGSTTGAGAAINSSSTDKKVVSEQAGIRVDKMKLSAKTTSLIGARLIGSGGIHGKFKHWVVPVAIDDKTFTIAGNFAYDDAVPLTLEYGKGTLFEHGYVQSAADKSIVIDDVKGAKGLNRDTKQTYKVIAKGTDHFRLAIPFINLKKVGQAFSDLFGPADAANKKKLEEAQREEEKQAKAKKDAEEKAERERARVQEEAQREQKQRAEQQKQEQPP